MTGSARPRRSMLYMPASNTRALDKGRRLPADGLIFDLEDAVAPDAKVTARGNVVAALATGGYGDREILIRANGLDTPWGRADIEAIAALDADGIVIPKVDSAETVHQVVMLLDAAGAPSTLRIWCMLETPRGVLHAGQIAESHARIAGLIMGTSDLANELQCAHTFDRLPMLTALGIGVLAARAAGIAVLDGVHLDLADDDGLRRACVQGRELGFDGKTLIHPKTIAVANDVFAPSADEIALSRRIIAAHEEAERAGQGVVVVDGRLIENLHVANAERLVAMAEAIERLDTQGNG